MNVFFCFSFSILYYTAFISLPATHQIFRIRVRIRDKIKEPSNGFQILTFDHYSFLPMTPFT